MPRPPRVVLTIGIVAALLLAAGAAVVPATAAPTATIASDTATNGSLGDWQPLAGDAGLEASPNESATSQNVSVHARVVQNGTTFGVPHSTTGVSIPVDPLVADRGDQLVVSVYVDGIYDRVDPWGASEATEERVLAELENGTEFSIVQTAATTPAGSAPTEIELNASNVEITGSDTTDADVVNVVVDLDAVASVTSDSTTDDPLGWHSTTGPRFVAAIATSDGLERDRSDPVDFVPRTVPSLVRDDGTGVVSYPATVNAENVSETGASDRWVSNRSRVTVHPTDTIAMAVRVDGLDERVDAHDGSFDERVLAALNETGNVTVLMRSESVGVQVDPAELWLNDSVVTAARGSSPDTYVLLVDADRVAATTYPTDARALVPPDDADVRALGWLYDDGTISPSFSVRLGEAESVPFAFKPFPEENASVAAWRVPHYVDAANASASDLRAHRDGDDRGGDADANAADANAADDPVLVTEHDRLAIEVFVPGLDDRLAHESENASANRTERVLAAIRESGHLSVLQTQETTTPELVQSWLWLNASNVRAVDAPGEDRYVLVVDPTATLAVTNGERLNENELAALYADEDQRYRFDALYEGGLTSYAQFRAHYARNDTHAGVVASSGTVQFVDATATVDRSLPLAPTANATIAGETTVAPGSELAVTVRPRNGAVRTRRTTVAENGTYRTAFDLAGLDAPTTIDVSVALVGDDVVPLTPEPVAVRVREREASIRFRPQTPTTQYVTAAVNLSHGGVLVLRNDDGVVDATTTLAAGSNQTVTFTLPESAATGTYRVVAYRGTADDRGEPYPDGTASATLHLDDEAETRTTTTRPTTTTKATSTAPTTTTPTTTDSGPAATTVVDDPSPVPGFDVALAVVALLAAVVVGVRRGRREN